MPELKKKLIDIRKLWENDNLSSEMSISSDYKPAIPLVVNTIVPIFI